MNPQDFLALATEILTHLSGQWHALADGEYSYPRISFEAPEHPGWSILMRMHWRENRLTVSASLNGLDGHLRRTGRGRPPQRARRLNLHARVVLSQRRIPGHRRQR